MSKSSGTLTNGVAVAAAVAGLFASVPSMAQSGSPLTSDRMVVRSLDLCWDVVDGGNAGAAASAQGMTLMPGARFPYYFRDVDGKVVTVSVSLSPNAAGEPEPACRITVLKPNLNTAWTPRTALLTDPAGLVDRIVTTMTGSNRPYQVVMRRQAHPGRRGHLRTLLRQTDGPWVKLLYVEEGPQAIEVLWAQGSARAMNAPGLTDLGTDPGGRVAAQAFVNDRWEIAFCELNPHVCETPAQARARQRAEAGRSGGSSSSSSGAQASTAPSTWTLPFSGIGSSGSGDNRTQSQRQRDDSWWRNYHSTGRGRFD